MCKIFMDGTLGGVMTMYCSTIVEMTKLSINVCRADDTVLLAETES